MKALPPILALFFCALLPAAGATHPASLESEYQINDRGMVRNFTLATDVVAVRTGGRRTLKPTQTDDPDTLAREIRSTATSTGETEEIELILNPDKKKTGTYSSRFATNRILVAFTPDADVEQLLKQHRLELIKRPAHSPGHVICAAADSIDALQLMQTLRDTDGIISADVLLARQAEKKSAPNDPLYPQQWHLSNTTQQGGALWIDSNVQSVWEQYDGSGVTISIVDDGVQYTHPDIQAHYDTTIDYDYNDGDNDPAPTSGNDVHGTACAGVAAAVGNNSTGIAGVAHGATLTGLRLISSASTDQTEAEAFSRHTDIIDISSNSWGPTDDGATLEAPGILASAALQNGATSGRNGLGVIYTWAAGNGLDSWDNSNADGYANSPYTIAVGAVNDYGFQSYYSEPGANLVVCAPSNGGLHNTGILTTDRTGSDGYTTTDYETEFGGTSSATPLVSGVCALMLQANPNLGWRDVQEILIRSARRVHMTDPDWSANQAGIWFNHKYGAGLVDAATAVAMAEDWTNLGTRTSATLSQTGLSIGIPDNDATGITRSFDFSDSTNLRVEHVQVTVNADHDYRGNLEFEITSPSGMKSTLMTYRADYSADFSNWTFMSVRHWGENAAGNWTVRIADREYGDTGILRNLTVTLWGNDVTGARIATDTPTLVTEGNLPPNSSADPGEKVTFSLPLTNIGNSSATNLSAEVVATGNIRDLTGTLDFGTIAPGETLAKPFTFQAIRGGQGTMANPVFRLMQDGTPTGTIAFAIPLGSTTTTSFQGSQISIPDNSPAATSSLVVSGITGTVQCVNATLEGFNHPNPYNLAALLAGPDDLKITLFDNASTTTINDGSFTFTDASKLLFPAYGPTPNGTYRPTSFELSSHQLTNAPSSYEPAYSMTEFSGVPSNGTWNLFVEDFTSGNTGSISSWALDFTSVDCTDNVFLDSGSLTVNEAAGTLEVDVIRTGGKAGSATAFYSTTNQTATAGSDYTAASGALTFSPGEWKKTISISITQDSQNESDETFLITLDSSTTDSPLGATTSATVTLVDDETSLAEWAAASGLAGSSAQALATPLNDGINNLLKFAFNLDPAVAGAPLIETGTGTAGLPAIRLNDANPADTTLRFEFVRRTNAPGLTYQPQISSTLSTGWQETTALPTTVTIDSEWERVIINEPVTEPATQAFGRIRIISEN